MPFVDHLQITTSNLPLILLNLPPGLPSSCGHLSWTRTGREHLLKEGRRKEATQLPHRLGLPPTWKGQTSHPRRSEIMASIVVWRNINGESGVAWRKIVWHGEIWHHGMAYRR